MVKANLPVLVDSRGSPLRPQNRRTAHEGASDISRELAGWQPGSYSPDGELLPELQRLRDRTRDIIRNHGIASGAVQTHVDNVIGAGLLLNAKPDRRALGVTPDDESGNEIMDELEDEIEAKFDAYSEDPGCYVDASRRSRLSALIAQAYRSYLTSFEICATAEWLPGRGSVYATAIQNIDPARLSNPDGKPDSDRLRGGVALGSMGEPTGYYFASRVAGDYLSFSADIARQWRYVPRETPWGRPMVLHIFDNDQPGQSRGKNGITSVLLKHKMLDKFEKVSLEAAAFNAMYCAYIESSLDWPSVAGALGAGEENDPTLAYMENVKGWQKESMIRFNGLSIPHLFPGEKLEHLSPQHPNPNFASFEEAALRYLAAGWNLTYEQLSRDYSKTNYSSARAAMLESWRFFTGKQYHIGGWYATLIYCLWLEEAFERGTIKIPAGLPGFLEAKAAWTTCEWIGPGRGHIDPLKEWNGKKVAYSLGMETLESLAASDGRRWRDLVDQKAQEARYCARRGVPVPNPDAPSPAQPARDDPEEPAPGREEQERADPPRQRRKSGRA